MLSYKTFHRLLRLLPNFLWPVKVMLIKNSIKAKGVNLKLGPNVMLYNFREIQFGDNVFIGDGSSFGGNVSIKIGSNVMFGPEVMIRGGDHNISVVGKPMAKVKEGGINLPVIIEDDVWIGARALILKGVRIGEGAIIGAGAIVTKDIIPYTINVGNPAHPLKFRFSEENLKKHLLLTESKYNSSDLFYRLKKKNHDQ